MKKIFLPIFLIFVLNSCTSYRALKHFNKDISYTQAVLYSKKADIVYKDVVKTIFYATFMNKVHEKYDDKYYNFVIGINSEEETLSDYALSLNNISYEKIKDIDQDSEIYKSISLKNAWAKYYYVSFKKDKDITSILVELRDSNYKKASISFRN